MSFSLATPLVFPNALQAVVTVFGGYFEVFSLTSINFPSEGNSSLK
jgi:hypothetical protein